MRIGLMLLIFSLLILQSKFDSEKNLNSIGNNQKAKALDSALVDSCIIHADTIIKHKEFPWAPNNDCKLSRYNIHGVIPAMYDSLIALSLENRLTNGLNLSKAKSNYHGPDYTENGIN